jgi:hypothetical protein
VKPTEVRIRQLSPVLVAGKEAKFECSTTGSRPRAIIYWLFDGKRHETALSGDHQTSAVITLSVKQMHNGATLTCVAENAKIANSSISDDLILDVQCTFFLNKQMRFVFILNHFFIFCCRFAGFELTVGHFDTESSITARRQRHLL